MKKRKKRVLVLCALISIQALKETLTVAEFDYVCSVMENSQILLEFFFAWDFISVVDSIDNAENYKRDGPEPGETTQKTAKKSSPGSGHPGNSQ